MDIAELGWRTRTEELREATADLDRFADEGERTAARTKKSMGTVDRALSSVKRAAAQAAFTLIGVFGAREVVRGIAEFDRSMSRVGAITRATGRDLEEMKKIALELGRTTEFTAAQAAGGLQFLGMAGFSARESIETIPTALDLATAASMDLSRSADILSNIMGAFSIRASESAEVADVLAAASSRANTDVSQLGQAMSTAGPVAANLGKSVAETAAMIGVLSDSGIQGARAGTSLRGVLASLAGPTEQAQEALAKYGITVQDVNPELHSMADIFAIIRERSVSTADAMEIFGREAASGALILAQGSERLREFSAELGNVSGEAGRMASQMRDNLGGDIDALFSALSGLILVIGDAGLTAALRTATQAVTGLVQILAEAVVYVGDFSGYAAAAAALIGAVYAPAVASAVFQTGLWIASLVTLRGVLLATGIGAFVVLAGLALNLLFDLSEATGGLGNVFARMGEIAALTFQGLVDTLGIFRLAWDAMISVLQVAWLRFIQGLQQAWSDFLGQVASGLSYIPAMEAQFKAVSLAAFDAATKASVLEGKIARAESAAASFGENASSLLADAFNPAIAKASQLLAIIQSLGAASAGAPDDGLRGGQEPNRPVIDIPSVSIPSVSIPGGGGGGGGGGGSVEDQFAQRLDQLMSGLQTERQAMDEWYQEGQEILADRRATELLTEQEHKNALFALEAQYQQKRLELGEQTSRHEVQMRERTVSLLSGLMGTLSADSKAAALAQIALNKGLAIAQTIQNTAAAAVRALVELGPVAGPPAAASIKAYGAAQVGIIAATGLAQAASSGGSGSAPSITSGFVVEQETAATVEQERSIRLTVEGDGIFADYLRGSSQQLFDILYEEGILNGKTIVS